MCQRQARATYEAATAPFDAAPCQNEHASSASGSTPTARRISDTAQPESPATTAPVLRVLDGHGSVLQLYYEYEYSCTAVVPGCTQVPRYRGTVLASTCGSTRTTSVQYYACTRYLSA